ncbi:MAG TPA: ABC transporter substrate-binding protein [Hyphomicrobiales bacterium]|nr:ABC transporter substrate-binding protein [Kaistiaceae bacterium]HQF30091.1 ABC transporter substrate-binding protein [Hyphomicrobiales bacterium]
MLKTLAVLALVATPLLGSTAAMAAEPKCEVDRPVVFAGLDWDSNSFHTAIASFVLEHGYGCKTDKIPGSTIPLLNGMARGDIDLTMEIWQDNVKDAWEEALEKDQVVDLGVNFPDAIQGWFVPKYLIEGDDAKAKGLKSVADLPKFKDVFKDPEEPEKGRFYNCIAGWGCEVINTKKFGAYGLDDSYVNFKPGTGAALSAAILSNIKRKKPIVFYYWGPTSVLGKVSDQVTMLEEPAFDEAVWDKLSKEDAPKEACAYPIVPVIIGANKKFAESAPMIVAFLKNYETTNAMVSEALAFMEDNGGDAEVAAKDFLTKNEDLWTKWVPEDVAGRVKAAL